MTDYSSASLPESSNIYAIISFNEMLQDILRILYTTRTTDDGSRSAISW